MPPIPHPSLDFRINQLHEDHKETVQLINRLANRTDGSDIISKIHESLKLEEEQLELLSSEIKDQPTPNATLSIQVTRLAEDFKQSRARFRAAQIASKRAAQAARAQERQALFSTSSSTSTNTNATAAGDPFVPRDKRTKDPRSGDASLAASSSVTDALRQTQRALEAEVEKSQFAQEILARSSEELKGLAGQYSDVDALLAASKGLVSELLTSTKTDTWYLETAVYLLLVTICWLVFRRLLYGPLWWLVWLPLRLTWKTLVTTVGVLGLLTPKEVQEGLKIGELSSSSISDTVIAMSSSRPDNGNMSEKEKENGNENGKQNQSGEGSKVEMVGRIVDESQIEEKPVRVRGDGTVLVDSDAPRNPKKRQMENNGEHENVPNSEQVKTKDEL